MVAEGYSGRSFLVRFVIVFRLNMDVVAESANDMHLFLSLLAENTSYKFVLSFQYENVRAYRESTFVWDWED